MVDFFDVNAVGSDSHLQFTNWTIDDNGVYDYAADTRGYTFAAIVEYQSQKFGVRFGEALMPTVANGIDLDWNLTQARAENLRTRVRPSWFKGLATYPAPGVSQSRKHGKLRASHQYLPTGPNSRSGHHPVSPP